MVCHYHAHVEEGRNHHLVKRTDPRDGQIKHLFISQIDYKKWSNLGLDPPTSGLLTVSDTKNEHPYPFPSGFKPRIIFFVYFSGETELINAKWDSSECRLVKEVGYIVTCECYQLQTFAVSLGQPDTYNLNFITRIGAGLAMIGVLLTLFTFLRNA